METEKWPKAADSPLFPCTYFLVESKIYMFLQIDFSDR